MRQTSRPGGLAVALTIDRATASRLGIAPTTIDNTLVRRLRPAPDQHHVYAAKPVSRDSGSRAAISAGSRQAQPSLYSVKRGRGHDRVRLPVRVAMDRLPLVRTRSPGLRYTRLPQILWRHRRMRLLTSTSNATSSKGAGSAGATSSATSNAVPLSAFSHFETKTQPLSINHQGQFPAITVSFNLAPERLLGGAISAITKMQQDMHMPASLQADFQGTAASFRNSLSNMPLLILAALVTVYIVLGSFVRKLHPSDHDSFHSSFGGRWRVPGADLLSS